MIWPVFVIDLAFNVATNLSKNRRQLGIGNVGDCWGLVTGTLGTGNGTVGDYWGLSGIGVPLTVVASAIVIFVEVEFDSTSKTVAD